MLILLCGAEGHSENYLSSNAVTAVSIQIAKADWDTLRFQARESEFFPDESKAVSTNSYSWFPAEVTVNGTKFPKSKVRKKGYIGSHNTRRPALKVQLGPVPNGFDPELTLNNNNQDPSLIRQYLGYHVFRLAGMPAPQSGFAKVTLNGNSMGIYTLVEPVKEAFLKQHFGSSQGNLYEGGRSDFRTGWYQNFEIKNNETTNRRQDLERFTKALETEGVGAVEKFVDTENFFKFWALESLLNHSDGFAGNANNVFVYHHPGRDRFVFIPWGLDRVFYQGRMFAGPASVIAVGILPYTLYTTETGKERYRKTLAGLLKDVWKEEELLREVDRLEKLLTPHVDPSNSRLGPNIESVRRFIKNRRAEIAPELQGPFPTLETKPMESAKRKVIGNLEGSFSSLMKDFRGGQAQAASTSETAMLKGEFYGEKFVCENVAVEVGTFQNQDGSSGRVLSIQGRIPKNSGTVEVQFVFDPDFYKEQKEIPIDNTRIRGYSFFSTPGGPNTRHNDMLKGTFTLERAGETNGMPVQGNFKAQIYSKWGQAK